MEATMKPIKIQPRKENVTLMSTDEFIKAFGASKTYFIFINDGQELLQISSGDYVSVYVKTDHIEEE